MNRNQYMLPPPPRLPFRMGESRDHPPQTKNHQMLQITNKNIPQSADQQGQKTLWQESQSQMQHSTNLWQASNTVLLGNSRNCSDPAIEQESRQHQSLYEQFFSLSKQPSFEPSLDSANIPAPLPLSPSPLHQKSIMDVSKTPYQNQMSPPPRSTLSLFKGKTSPSGSHVRFLEESNASHPQFFEGSLPTAQVRFAEGTSRIENEDRRARRLARNRESARQSRRRKKELLQTLTEKKNQLKVEIDKERCLRINLMEPGLREYRNKLIDQVYEYACIPITDDSKHIEKHIDEILTKLILNGGPNCRIRRAILSFQYTLLRRLLLPRYHQFLCWLLLRPESFFTSARDERARTGRVSSKQIGEELIAAHNSTQAGVGTLPLNASSARITSSQISSDNMVIWPLLCHELSMSVDQENLMMEAHKRTNSSPQSFSTRVKVESSINLVSNLNQNVLYYAESVSQRKKTSFCNILSPHQSSRYLHWYKSNRARIKMFLQRSKVRPNSGDTREKLYSRLDAKLKIER